MDCNKCETPDPDPDSDLTQDKLRIRKTAYVFNDDLAQASDLIPNIKTRVGNLYKG